MSNPPHRRLSSGRAVSAWRRWYRGLHPSLQLIGCQLWLPLFFITMFCFCYIAAFKSPGPHEVPVAVVGPTSEVDSLRRTAADTMPGILSVERFESVAEAQRAVLRGDVAVAYDSGANEISVASAHQIQAATIVPELLRPVIAAHVTPAPAVTELAPLPAHDRNGLTAMYLMLAWCIGGYMTAMFIGMMGGPLRHRTRFTVIGGLGLVLAVLTNIFAGPVIGAIQGHLPQLILTSWAWIVSIGLAVNGLSYFFGRFIALPAMVIFIFLSVPSSGAAYPKWFMPEPFAWLNHVVVGSGITEMIKHVVYGVGPGNLRGLIMMLSYAVLGIVLALVGKQFWERRRLRRIIAGRTTMFNDAQRLNREFLSRERDEILAAHGLRADPAGDGVQVIAPPVAERDRSGLDGPMVDDPFSGFGNAGNDDGVPPRGRS